MHSISENLQTWRHHSTLIGRRADIDRHGSRWRTRGRESVDGEATVGSLWQDLSLNARSRNATVAALEGESFQDHHDCYV